MTATSSRWVWASTLGKAYGVKGFFTVLAAIALVAPWRPRWRVILFAVAATLAAGSRLTVAPALLVFWIVMIFREKGQTRSLAAGVLVHLGLSYSYGQYSTPYVPLMIIASTAEALARREAAAVVLHNFPSAWNFSWSVPGFKTADPERMGKFYTERAPFIVLLPRD